MITLTRAALPGHRELQRLHEGGVVPQSADTWRWGCHALGARARPAHLVAEPGKRVCKTAHLGSKGLLGRCSKTQ